MDDPETRDREPDGIEEPEPGASMMHAGTEGSPETIGASQAGAVGPGQATLDGILGAEGPTTAIDAEDATLAPRGNGDPTPQPMPVIPGYRVEGELGRGGMGVVYRARQVRLNRPVAVKMILAGQHAGAEAAARFLAEAEAVAQLQHPNIVQIFHIDEHDGFPYFEMEYVGGGSLAARLDGTPWPSREAARLMETLAAAMAEAHRRGVVHRDLKPANILLTPEGVPKVADFGLAKLLNVESALTRTDSVLGSPSYMAPEQAEGKTKDVGPAADIYALGAILYELLVGRPPFRGATVLETLQQVKTAEPVPPSRLVPGLPRDAETIALKCLQKDPARRYESATALAEDLRRYLAGEPIVARPVGPAERAWRSCKRNPVVSTLAIGFVLALVGGLVGVISLWIRSEWQGARIRLAYDELHYQSYVRTIQFANRAWDDQQIPLMRRLIDEARPGPGEADHRGFEWSYLDRLSRLQADTLMLRGHREGAAIQGVAYSPNGTRIASGSWDGTIKIWDAVTARTDITIDGGGAKIGRVAFSPDGTRVASAQEDGTVGIWDVKSGERRDLLAGHSGPVRDVAFSPDGTWLASAGSDKTIKLWETSKDREPLTLTGHTDEVRGVAFSPDGRLLASAGGDKTIKVWDVTTRQELQSLVGHDEAVNDVAFSPDGRRLASGDDKSLMVWDMTEGRSVLTMRGRGAFVSDVAFSPDGRYLATASDITVRIWDADTGEVVRILFGHPGSVNAVAFSPDGTRLASVGQGPVRVWDWKPATERAARTLADDGVVVTVKFSPDGTRLASVGNKKGIRIWDTATGRISDELPGDSGPNWALAFSPDGTRLASANYDKTITIWDLSTRRPYLTLTGHDDRVLGVAFSRNGTRLASASNDDTVRIWDAATGREVLKLVGHEKDVREVAFSPDGKLLASAGHFDGIVKVWDAETGRVVHDLKAGPEAGIVAFSPDGKRLGATGGSDPVAIIWDVATGREVHKLVGHGASVWGLAFSTDGRRIATGSVDRTVKLWDAGTGQELLTLKGHKDWVTGVAFSRDGKLLASGSAGTVNLWDSEDVSPAEASGR